MRANVRVAVALVAAALAAAPAGDVRAERADGRIAAGERAFSRGEFDAALAAFSAAYEETGMAALLYNIAMCQWELDRPADAVRTFRRYLRADGASLSATDLAEIERVLGELRPRHGDLDLEVAPAGARVTVDGEEVGEAPFDDPVAVEPGVHQVRATAEGMEPALVTASVQAGETEEVEITLAPPAPEAPVEELPPESPSDEGPRPARPLGWWFWATTGLTAAAAVGLSITGGLALDAHGTYEESGHLDLDAYDSGRTLGVTTDALIGVAAASAVAALLSLVLHYTLPAGAAAPAEGAASAGASGPLGGVAWQ